MKINIIHIIILYTLFTTIKSECVCTERELSKEIRDDLRANNGKLSCIINGEGTYNNETIKTWVGGCSFKANFKEWEKSLKRNYQLKNGVVDINGNEIKREEEIDNQADICIIIRTLLNNNYFPGFANKLDMIPESITSYINCPGSKGQSEICAANANSFDDRDSWYIFLDGGSLSYNGIPNYQATKY